MYRLLMLATISVFFSGALIHGQSTIGKSNRNSGEEILARAAGPIGFKQVSVVSALIFGFSNAKVPGGIATVVNCNGSEPNVTMPSDASIKQLLSLVKFKAPEYDWRIDDGVVVVIPNTGFPVPMDIRVNDFHVENVTASQAMNSLLENSDLKRGFESRGLFRGLEVDGGGFPLSKTRITLNLKDATLLEILNAIVRADGRAVWGYILNPCHGSNQYQLKLLVN